MKQRLTIWNSHEMMTLKALVAGIAVLMGIMIVGSKPTATLFASQPEVGRKSPSDFTSTMHTPKTPINDYIVSPEDLLDVIVIDVPEVSRTYRVSSNGLLTLPLLPQPIPAAGKTLDELAQLIAADFHAAGMINNAQVTVQLKETKLHTVLVSGQVRSANAYAIYGPTHLLDMLIQAGGLSDTAGDSAIIYRGKAGESADAEESARTGAVDRSANGQSFTLSIRKLVETGDDTNNILLYPGDRVTVQRAEMIYIMGAVGRPGGYVVNESRKHWTVMKALVMAGDVTSIAKKRRILILRHEPSQPEDQRTQIPVDYKAIIQGKIEDVRLEPDDILYVPESTGLKAMRQSISSVVSIATMGAGYMMIYH